MIDAQQAAALMDSQEFQNRVRLGMWHGAQKVISETKSGKAIADQKRHDLAVEVLRKPTIDTELAFRRIVLVKTTGQADQEVIDCCKDSGTWNNVAGVCGLDG